MADKNAWLKWASGEAKDAPEKPKPAGNWAKATPEKKTTGWGKPAEASKSPAGWEKKPAKETLGCAKKDEKPVRTEDPPTDYDSYIAHCINKENMRREAIDEIDDGELPF